MLGVRHVYTCSIGNRSPHLACMQFRSVATKHPKVYRRQIVAEQPEYIQSIQKGIGVMAAMGIEIREGM